MVLNLIRQFLQCKCLLWKYYPLLSVGQEDQQVSPWVALFKKKINKDAGSLSPRACFNTAPSVIHQTTGAYFTVSVFVIAVLVIERRPSV